MAIQLRTLVPAVLVLGGMTYLTGCNESASPSSETKAKPASVTKTAETESAAPTPAATEEPHTLASAKNVAAKTGAKKNTIVPRPDAGVDPAMLSVSGNSGLGSNEPSKPKIVLESEALSDLTVRAEPEELNIGDIATGESGVGVIKLINDGKEPVKLAECRSSCGCTAAKCPRGQTIEPGKSLDIEITMTGLTRPSETQTEKVMRFQFEGQQPLVVPVRSRTVSFVDANPWSIDKDTTEDSKVELTSTDGQPFRIVKMHPPIVEEFSTEPAVTHTIAIDWAKWEELGSSRRLTFYMDHPKCDKLFVAIEYAYKQRPESFVNAQSGAPIGPNPGISTVERLNGSGPIDFPSEGTPLQAPVVINDPVALIKANKKDELLKFIEDGTFELEESDRTGATLLSQAAHYGKVNITKELIALGANIESQDRIGKTPLMWAGHARSVELIHTLLDAGADVNARDSVVGTALSWTAGFGDGESVRALLDAGADANVTGTMGFTPIIWASLTGEADSVEALIGAGAELEKADLTPSGATPLMHAAQTGKADNVAVLVKHGAKLESKDNEGKTPVLIASEKSGGNVETLKVLIEAGADLSAKDLRGRSALDLAKTRTDPRAPEVIAYLEKVMGVSSSAPNTPSDE